jgi:hypothetical protein
MLFAGRVVVFAGAAFLLMAVLPDVALACPVCFDGRDENRQAFLATTAFMSLLPLGMVAGTGLWIRRRTRELDELHGEGSGEQDSAQQGSADEDPTEA